MPGSPPSVGKITLDSGLTKLVKGGAVSLLKGGKPLASPVRISLGWESAADGPSIDLDASCIAFDAGRKRIETAWFMKRSVFDGAIAHTDSGNEAYSASIAVRLGDLPQEVCGLVFVLNSFSGRRLTDIQNASCRLLDVDTGEELVRFDLPEAEPRPGVAVCKMVRHLSGEWVMTALAEYADAKTARGMVQPAAKML